MDGFLVALQAAIRGHLVRRDLVQSVRCEYEEIFKQVEGDFKQNYISWSNNKSICYPTTDIIPETPIGDPIEFESTLPSPHKSVSEISLQESLTEPQIATMDIIGDLSQLSLTHNYPASREELLKLREQLSLELLWVRQAIQSRLQYLQALSRMHS